MGSPEAYCDAVRRIAGARLGRPVAEDAPLLDEPGFDSLAMADIVEGIEDELGIELPAQLLVPATFKSVSTLAAAVDKVILKGGVL
nr:phosphopantetheine-binding protein [Curtobacterium flaccumfaciens]